MKSEQPNLKEYCFSTRGPQGDTSYPISNKDGFFVDRFSFARDGSQSIWSSLGVKFTHVPCPLSPCEMRCNTYKEYSSVVSRTPPINLLSEAVARPRLPTLLRTGN